METTLKRERNIDADVIRCLAFFTVVSVHFFLNSGYYYVPVVGEKMLVLTTLVFVFFINLDYSKTPKWITWIFKKASPLCFAGYLLSWIFDDIFYPILNTKVPDVTKRLFGFIIIVPTVYVCSLLLSFVLCKLQEGIEKFFRTFVF